MIPIIYSIFYLKNNKFNNYANRRNSIFVHEVHFDQTHLIVTVFYVPYPVEKSFLLLCLLFLAGSLAVKAQTNTKGIYIVHTASKIPLPGVSVAAADGSFNSISDEHGFVDMHTIPATATKLVLSCMGFRSLTIDPGSLSFADNTACVGLVPQTAGLQDITVSSQAHHSIFKNISDLDIHLRPINNSQEVLRMVPGLFIGQHAGGGKAEQIFLRGFDLTMAPISIYL